MKQIIFYIIAIIGAFALYFWKENEILAAGFVALVLYIAEKFKTNELKKKNKALRIMNKSNLKLNAMDDQLIEDLNVILQQVQYARNPYPTIEQTTVNEVLDETIENLESVIGGGGILNSPPK